MGELIRSASVCDCVVSESLRLKFPSWANPSFLETVIPDLWVQLSGVFSVQNSNPGLRSKLSAERKKAKKRFKTVIINTFFVIPPCFLDCLTMKLYRL